VLLARLAFFFGRPGAAVELATRRTVVDMVFGRVTRFSVKFWATFVRVPAACPSVRATVFNKGSFVERFCAGI